MLKQYSDDFFIRELPASITQEKGTLVYLHGLGESGYCFEKLIHHPLLKGWHQYALDLYGYGKTSWTTNAVSLIAHAEMVANWLTNHTDAEEEKIILVGHSMSGVIGLYLCEQFPQLIKAFINIEGNVSAEDCITSAKIAAYSEIEFIGFGFEKTKQSVYALAKDSEAFRCYYPSLCLCDPKTYYLNSVELVNISNTNSLAGRLGALRIPQIYLYGDPNGTQNNSRQQLLKYDVNCQPIANSGHWPFIDNVDTCADAIQQFLEEVKV